MPVKRKPVTKKKPTPQLKRQNQRLMAENKLLAEQNRRTAEIASAVTHQLRTPLSGIKWVMKMLLDGDAGKLTPEQASLLQQAYERNERIIRLANDVLNIIRIDTGNEPYRFAPQRMEEIVENVLFDFIGTLRKKKIVLVIHTPARKLPPIHVAPEQMRTPIQNLVDNAVKYTPPKGRIEITLRRNGSAIEMSVRDTGIGIPKHQQHKLFTRFFRCDNAVQTEAEGSGLGLFIVKNIIEKHGGSIHFTSRQNEGTTFTLTVPLHRS